MLAPTFKSFSHTYDSFVGSAYLYKLFGLTHCQHHSNPIHSILSTLLETPVASFICVLHLQYIGSIPFSISPPVNNPHPPSIHPSSVPLLQSYHSMFPHSNLLSVPSLPCFIHTTSRLVTWFCRILISHSYTNDHPLFTKVG